MSFWKNLVDSYNKNADILSKTYPLSTTSISNNTDFIAVIIIDQNGNFKGTEKIEKAKRGDKGTISNICIPVSEKSMGRSSGIAPYPVFDKYEYLKGIGDKFEAYLTELKKFSDSKFATQQVKAIYNYVLKRTIKEDLRSIEPKDNTNILFKVEITDNPQAKVWEDKFFFDAWHHYYLSEKSKLVDENHSGKNELETVEKKKSKKDTEVVGTISLDYITGELQPLAISHPKKISNFSANSKLISDNDDMNFTFRGKFDKSSEAFSIGYESSQKAHQFLRYIINERGYYCGEQVIFSYTIGSFEDLIPPPIDDNSILSSFLLSNNLTDNDKQIRLRTETGFDYADALKKSLESYGYSKALHNHPKTAVVALDAATTGRFSIKFYRELSRNEYIENIADWHNDCKWNQRYWSNDKQDFIHYTSAPSMDKIIEAVYGKPRGNNDASYIKIKKAARERLLRCIFDKAFLPKDYVLASMHRASNPLGITSDGKFDRNIYEQILSTTCALIRKDYKQYSKEDFKLSIEHDRSDRDYLYGRLLGAADKLEEYALFKKEKDRVTAAIRHMQTFAQRPFSTWQTIHSCLNPYIKTVKGGFAFQEIEQIKNKFLSVEDFRKDTPLDGSYLIGYYHERAYIDNLVNVSKKKTTDNNEKEDNND